MFQSFKKSKSEDIDGLKLEPIIFVLDLICTTLAHIYNLALDTGVFPEKMKTAKVTVIYKGGDKNNLGN